MHRLMPAPSTGSHSRVHPDQVDDESPSASTRSLARKYASNACIECRSRKRKCSGERPCESCVALRKECLFDESLDGRRRPAIKRNREELEFYRKTLTDLVHSLRHGSRTQINHLLSVIQDSSTLDEVAMAVDDALKQGPEETTTRSPFSDELQSAQTQIQALQTTQTSRPSSRRRKLISIQSLSDEPLVDVRAWPWTNVSDDDHFVSHLVSLYLSWEHATWHVLDREAFLDNMVIGSLDSRLCSPLLVNSMLAVACDFSDHPSACSVPGDVMTRGDHFSDETKRLWDAQKGRSSLTNVQGLYLMGLREVKKGNDKLAQMYTRNASEMMDDMLNSKLGKRDRDILGKDVRYQRALRVSAWGIFSVNTLLSMGLHNHKIARTPQIPRPDLGSQSSNHISWSPYPQSEPSLPAHLGETYTELCNISEICNEINNNFIVSPEDQRPEQLKLDIAMALLSKLDQWYNGLPDLFHSGKAVPHILHFHIHYHWARLNTFRFFTSHEQATISATQAQHAQHMCINCALQIANLVDLYTRRHGVDRMYMFFAWTASVAFFTLLAADDLHHHHHHPARSSSAHTTSSTTTKSHDALVVTARVLRAAVRRFTFAKGMMRMARLTAQQLKLELPGEVETLLRDFERRDWSTGDARLFRSSDVPNYTLLVKTGAIDVDVPVRLTDLLEEWDEAEEEGT